MYNDAFARTEHLMEKCVHQADVDRHRDYELSIKLYERREKTKAENS